MMTRIIFAGYGGQGVILAGKLLAVAAMQSGKSVSHIPSYGVEMRGGTANCSVVVTSPDVVCIFNDPSLAKFGPLVRKGGLLFYNSSLIKTEPAFPGVTSVPVAANDLAEAAGSYRAANMAMVGALVARVPDLATVEALVKALDAAISTRKKDLLELNGKALRAGYQAMMSMAK
jgi:2-oxoglutarate ferredoxin oxidoreductase subunit gamma